MSDRGDPTTGTVLLGHLLHEARFRVQGLGLEFRVQAYLGFRVRFGV